MQLKKIVLISLCILVYNNHQPCAAEQVSFNKLKRGDDYLFKYQWLNSSNEKNAIEFLLPKKQLFTHFRGFKNYKPKMAQEFVALSLKKHFRDNPVDNIKIAFSNQSGQLTTQISGADNKAINAAYHQVAKLEEQFTEQYLHKNYYHIFTMDNKRGIKPDHVRIANESVDDLKTVKPVILNIVTVKNIRKVVNFILGFVQSIPYETLQSRATSSGAGFNTPLRVLWENKGDCDSKVTLTVALLRALMPRIKIALIFIDNHAIFGINVPAQNNETTITFEGTEYVLADPTGPALMNLGQLTDETKNIILSGHYAIEILDDE
ncbi:hypothetical protein ACOYR1_15125 [Thalassotalea piscium]